MSAAQSEQFANAGWALVGAGNPRGALDQFKSALAADPENTNALTGLAQSHLNLNEISQADEPTAAILRLTPNSATGHRLRAEILRRKRQPHAAAKAAREAIALDPREPRGYHILALCLSDQKDNRGAVRVCTEGLAVAPDTAFLLAQRADNMMELKGGKAAEPDGEAALHLAPDSEYVLRVAARIAIARNQRDRARDMLSLMLRRNANNREALSLYLMTEPRHRILGTLYVFRYWRKEHRMLGWAAYIGLWTAFIAVIFLIALVGNLPGVIAMLGARVYLHTRHAAHSREVQAHFAQFALKGGF